MSPLCAWYLGRSAKMTSFKITRAALKTKAVREAEKTVLEPPTAVKDVLKLAAVLKKIAW